MPNKLPLNSFYFFYFAALGVLAPHWGPYLESLGFNAAQIGTLMALYMGTRMIAPILWAWLGDHLGDRLKLTRIAAALTFLSFLAVFWRQDYQSLLWVMVFYSAFWNASLPQFEAITMNRLRGREHLYGRVRAWGSWGFVASAFVVGVLREHFGDYWVPIILAGTLLGIFLATLVTQDDSSPQQDALASSVRFWPSVCKKPVIALLLVCFLLQLAHAPYYAFFSIYLESHGYSQTMVGVLWNLGVIAEIAIFLTMGQLLSRFSTRKLLLAVVLISACRWAMIALAVDNLPILLVAQVLHMVSFGLYHATAIHLIHRHFVGRTQARGQALYGAISFGAGGSLGAWLSGYCYSIFGGEGTFIAAALIAFSAIAIIPWLSQND